MQTRWQSMIETCISTAVGFLIALLTQLIVFHLYSISAPLSTNLQITAIFTVVSIARGYLIRRFFNWFHERART
jgi:high-affinity nickel permease